MAVQLLKHRFTVEEYDRMAQGGVFREDDRIELLDGEIVEISPIGSRHAACVARLTAKFSRMQERGIVWVQNLIRLDEHSEPQPDLSLLKSREDFYAQAHPGPENVLLVVEVAETSIDYDREVKLPLYARAGISEVWLVDLAAGCVEIYQTPSAQGYGERRQVRPGQSLSPLAFPDLDMAVSDILG